MTSNLHNNKKESNNPSHGLPDIAEQNSKYRLPLLMVIIALAILSIGGFYYVTQEKSQESSASEETYSTQFEIPQPVSDTQDIKSSTEKKTAAANTKVVTQDEMDNNIDPQLIQQQLALIEAKQRELQQRLAAPLMLVNANANIINTTGAESQTQAGAQDPNTQFMQQVAGKSAESVTANHIGSLNTIVAQGYLIHAILESATDSDLPGFLRASVSTPVYAEDGSQILIPIGSRLIGQYKSGMIQGQSRIFIVWSRLITPRGISIQLGSPGVDNLGVAGMPADEINRHFWQRFGNASLLSLIGAGAANTGVNGQDQNNSAAVYREALANSFSQSASQSLQQESMIAPSLKTYQGKPIIVFVAKDIHFENVMSQVKPSINVF